MTQGEWQGWRWGARQWYRAMLIVLAGIGSLGGLAGAQEATAPQVMPPIDVDVCQVMPQALAQAQVPQKAEVFLRIQQRVITFGCVRLNEFQEPAWYLQVLPSFLNAFLNQVGRWPEVQSNCQAVNTAALWCVNDMVTLHIQQDLRAAVLQVGCGTEHDWAFMQQLIEEAAWQEGFIWGVGAVLIVPFHRQDVRLSCLWPALKTADGTGSTAPIHH